jgi:GTP-binding protein EngB required for normal cell division
MGVGPAIIFTATTAGVAIATSGGGDSGGGGGGDNSHQIQQVQEDIARQQRERENKQKEMEKQQNEDKQKLEDENKELKRKLEEDKEKIQKERDLAEQKRKEEIEQIEKEKQNKIKNANDFFNEEKDKYEKEKLNEIKNTFNSNKNNFCSNQANKLESFINEQIPQIFKALDNKIKEKISQCYSDILNDIKNINSQKKKRILLIGKTGVGKSTLINAIFDFDLAETGFGRPITMHDKPKNYEYNTHPDIELFDSRGIEIDPNYGVEMNYNRIKNFINEQLQKNEPLDAIWYCITGNKVEDVELDLIKKLRALYKDNSLSAIIVYTQSFFEEDFLEMKNYLLNKVDDQLIIHNVLAKMKKMQNNIIKRFGLDELLAKTKDLIESNSNLVLISTAKAKTEKKIEELINEKFSLNQKIQFNSIFETTISSFLGNECITQDIKNLIQTFYSQYNEKRNFLINENLKPIIEKEAQNMSNDLKNICSNVLNKFDNVISIEQKGFLEEYKNKISELLLNIAQEYGSNNLDLEIKVYIEKAIKNYFRNLNKNYISSI